MGLIMYWMPDERFELEVVVKRCEQPAGRGDSCGELRYRILNKIMLGSANNQSWMSASHLALTIERTLKQCERVWQICMEERVLRPFNGGYSAIEWMKERKYFSDAWKQKQQPDVQQPPQQRPPQPPPVPNSPQRGIVPYQTQQQPQQMPFGFNTSGSKTGF